MHKSPLTQWHQLLRVQRACDAQCACDATCSSLRVPLYGEIAINLDKPASKITVTYTENHNPRNNRNTRRIRTSLSTARQGRIRPMALRRAGASLSQRLLPQQAQCATGLWEQTSQIMPQVVEAPG